MKRLLTATALVMLGLSPATGAACEDSDASSASATPPALLGAAPAPAASTVPAPKVARALVPKPAKQAVAKAKGPVPDQKVASVSAARN